MVVHDHTPFYLPTFPPAMEDEKFYIAQSVELETIN